MECSAGPFDRTGVPALGKDVPLPTAAARLVLVWTERWAKTLRALRLRHVLGFLFRRVPDREEGRGWESVPKASSPLKTVHLPTEYAAVL